MKKSFKRPSAKVMTRIAASAVAIVIVTVLLLTGWFIRKTLNEVAVAKTANGSQQLRIEGVNIQLLEKALTFKDEKSSDGRRLGPDLGNPFARPDQPQPPAPTPVPEPEPAPPETPAPPAQ